MYFGRFKLVLGLVLSWFSFGWKISDENGKNWPFMQKLQGVSVPKVQYRYSVLFLA